jgi:putative transposase
VTAHGQPGMTPMRHLQHPEGVILHLLHEADAGASIAEICSTARISPRTFYRWRKRYGGLTLPAALEVKDLHLENQRLRALVTSLSARLEAQSATHTQHAATPFRPDLGYQHREPSDAIPIRGATVGRYSSVRGQR